MQKLSRFHLVLSLSFLAIFIFAGCGKKPKLNLEGLQSNPPGSAIGGGGGFDDDFRTRGDLGGGLAIGDPILTPIGDTGGGAGGTGADGFGALDGGWAATDTPLTTGSSFLKNGSYWNDKVYFDYNRSEVRASERPKLDALAAHLRENPGMGAVIEGHCDERGSDEYNRALSERRSLSVLEYLAALGIGQQRLHTVSYGEDRPVVPNATNEADHQRNRRAEFLLGDQK